MAPPKLMVLTEEQYRVLDAADPNGFYRQDQRDRLLRWLQKLENFHQDCSRFETALRKKFRGDTLGLHLPEGQVSREGIHIEGGLLLEGRHEADVSLGGGLVVTETGELTGRVEARSVVCRGLIRGDILARETVHLCARGAIHGNVKAACLQIEDGARFMGHCHLEPECKPAPRGLWTQVLEKLGMR